MTVGRWRLKVAYLDPGSTVHGVVEVANVDGPHKHADPCDDLAQLVAKLLNLDLQGRLAVLRLADVGANLTWEHMRYAIQH